MMMTLASCGALADSFRIEKWPERVPTPDLRARYQWPATGFIGFARQGRLAELLGQLVRALRERNSHVECSSEHAGSG